MILSLVSRGILAVPHANRPLGLIFNAPAAFAPAHLLEASWLLHGHYLVVTGLLTGLLLLCLEPQRPRLALLGGAFAATVAPSDELRLIAIYSSAYAGVAAATALVLLLLAMGAKRPVLIIVAGGLGFLSTRVHEGCLPVLVIAPVLLGCLGLRFPRRFLAFYYAAMALAFLVILLPFSRGAPDVTYQREILGVTRDLPTVLERTFTQFRLQVAPLFVSTWTGMVRPRALASAVILLCGLLVLPSNDEPRAWRRSALLAAVGVVGMAGAYSAFVLAARLAQAGRMEMIAAPWTGMMLAATITLAGEALPRPARVPLVGALAFLTMAGAGSRTARMQDFFDVTAEYPRQAGAMRQLVTLAPDLKPGTLVIYVDDKKMWLGTFVFHHAVDLMYNRRAAGCVTPAREEVFYSCWMEPDGIHWEPWPVLRGPWGIKPVTYRFDEVVVVRSDAQGRVTLAEDWPKELPSLPEGATYSPRTRVVATLSSPLPSRTVLERLP